MPCHIHLHSDLDHGSYKAHVQMVVQIYNQHQTHTHTSCSAHNVFVPLAYDQYKFFQKLNRKEVFNKQTKLIEAINKNITPSIFKNFIPNYKNLATISQIFSMKTNVKQRVLLEKKIIEDMTSIDKLNENVLQPIDNIVYKTFVSKFNEKYSGSLISEQKELLNKYIVSFVDNGIDLKLFMNEEINRLKNELNNSFTNENISSDVEMIEKTKNVLNLLESFKEKQIDDKMLMKVLKIQDLVKEIQSDASRS